MTTDFGFCNAITALVSNLGLLDGADVLLGGVALGLRLLLQPLLLGQLRRLSLQALPGQAEVALKLIGAVGCRGRDGEKGRRKELVG